MIDLDNIQDYYNIAKSADTVTRFHLLLKRLAFEPRDFTRKEAAELLDIIDNEQENLKLLAETFKKAGEKVEIIPEENWDGLRKQVLMYLIS